jgi:hypothetical protein
MKTSHASEGQSAADGRHVAEERLDVQPVEECLWFRVPNGSEEESLPERPGCDRHANHLHIVARSSQRDVLDADEACISHTDDVMAKEIACQQDLAGTALEGTQVQPVDRQSDRTRIECGHILHRHEDVAVADADDEPGKVRIASLGQTSNHVSDLTYSLP